MSPVQPRACGEHSPSTHSAPLASGSAPRLRGTRISGRAPRPCRRFSPAPAGNTILLISLKLATAVQPRACGEHKSIALKKRRSVGSAPRLRGTLPMPIATSTRTTVQPRACGEHKLLGGDIPTPIGSAPRLRGTPAKCSRGFGDGSVQPRACGEHHTEEHITLEPNGSAPRLRGTQRSRRPPPQGSRFSPAPAGNTLASAWRRSFQAVQPRACGEHRRA